MQKPKINTEGFSIQQGTIFGLPAELIQPDDIKTKFDQQNKYFRSSIWSDNKLVSGSWFKFVNWGENPEHFPPTKSLKNCQIVEKIDGSTLIVDRFQKEINMRTRGTFSYENLNNAVDFLEVQEKYKFDFVPENQTWLFEIITPNNQIVVRYREVDAILTGIVNKSDYTLVTQAELDQLAEKHGLLRPSYYEFESIEEMLTSIDKWKGKEGAVIYSNNGQSLHKVKSEWYRALHRIKDELKSYESVVDLFLTLERPTYVGFKSHLESAVDYEIFQSVQFDMSKVCDTDKKVKEIEAGMLRFIEKIKLYPTRKEQAIAITQAYGPTNRASMLFTLLDGKPLTTDQVKKLFLQS